MTQKNEGSSVVKIGRFTGIPQEDIDPLAQELKRLGFHVQQSQFKLDPQNAMEWALPSLVTVLVSTVGTLGALTFKKYMDGLLEELGVKSLGSQTGKALKHAFQKGVEIEAAYYKRLKEKIDPIYCPPLKLELRLGGKDLSNPPWQLKFIFTRELEEFFDYALECVSPVVRDVGVMRNRLTQDLLIKLRNPDRYYGRSLEKVGVDSIVNELSESVVISSGVFLFDVPERTWVRIASQSGVWSPTEVLKSWFSTAS